MPALPENFYADWRVRGKIIPILRDDADSPPETLLQAIWQHQRLSRDQLRTMDGDPVQVLHPGFRSVEGGPDFRDAVLRFAGQGTVAGDVEVDLRAAGWRAHGHDRNPAFRRVLLHVVWDEEASSIAGPPRLALRRVLDAPIGELSVWLGNQSPRELPEIGRGRCCGPFQQLSRAAQLELLRQAASVRLRGKGEAFRARARQAGWEQALWEGLFRGLGYKHNAWPMQRLAELRPRWLSARSNPVELQARLLGASGLLPGELKAPAREPAGGRAHAGGPVSAPAYLRRVWDIWWRERDAYSDCALPPAMWRLHGVRPANHPQRRLALAAHWALKQDLPARLEHWCGETVPDAALVGSLGRVLEAGPDEFWSWHWSLNSARLKSPQPLLGESRVTDLAINTVLPWLWVRAVEGCNEALRRRIEERLFAWPAAQDNTLLQLARQRLLGASSRRVLPGAAVQQGLVQIVRDFCEHSNAVCDGCKMPALVEALVSRELKMEPAAQDLPARLASMAAAARPPA